MNITVPRPSISKKKRLGSDVAKRHGTGVIRTADRLAALPSISKLASRTQAHVHSHDDNDEDVEFNSNGGRDDSEDPLDHVKIEMSNVRRRATLPPAVMYQINMENTVHRHREVDLNITDDINKCTLRHFKYNDVDIKSSKVYNRSELVSKLEKVYNLSELKPKLHNVKLHDGGTATVPVFNVKATLLKMLNNPELMKPENIATNYDIFSGKPVSPSTKLDEIHTGNAWEPARQFYCGDDPDALAMGLVLFYDKTHSGLFGSLAAAPLLAVPTFLNRKCRADERFHSVLGYIPNLAHGKGKSNNQSAKDKLQDEHNCLRLITDQLKQIHEDGGIWTEVMGKRVCVKVWIHIISGDTSGHNNVCGHYNASNSNCPYRDCICTLLQLSNALANCYLTKIEDVEGLTPAEMKEWSKHDIDNAFDHAPLSDMVHGKFGVCPAEMLHVCGNGIYKYQFDCIRELVGPKASRKQQKKDFDDLHQQLVSDSARQSDRDFPRNSSRSGALDGTKMSATERLGNMMISVSASVQLAFDKWVNESNEIHEVESALPLVHDMIVALQHCFPRTFGNGWCLPKMNSLAKMTYYMLKFGSANNFTGQVGERVLKSVVKDVAQQTQRRPRVFAEQCAQRHFENVVLEHADEDMRCRMDLNWMRVSNDDLLDEQMRGRYDMTFHECDARGKGPTSLKWANKDRQHLGVRVCDSMKLAIREFAVNNGWRGQFSVTGYTSMTIKTTHADSPRLFHASELCHGTPWYDYGMVKYVDDDDTINHSPAQIMGFFKYSDRGVPTPKLSKEDEYTFDEIRYGNMKDDTMYAVVHSAKKPYISWDRIKKEFVVPFQMGDVKDHLYIVYVKTITDALFVFEDYGGEDSDKRFCVLPYRLWGQYFSDRVYADDE